MPAQNEAVNIVNEVSNEPRPVLPTPDVKQEPAEPVNSNRQAISESLIDLTTPKKPIRPEKETLNESFTTFATNRLENDKIAQAEISNNSGKNLLEWNCFFEIFCHLFYEI